MGSKISRRLRHPQSGIDNDTEEDNSTSSDTQSIAAPSQQDSNVRRPTREDNSQRNNVSLPTEQTTPKKDGKIREDFYSVVLRYFNKEIRKTNKPRISVKGQVEKYPFWISAWDVTELAPGGDSNKTVKFYELVGDNKQLIPSRIPHFLISQIGKVIKIQSKYETTSLHSRKRKALAEYDVLKKTIDKLYLSFDIVDNQAINTGEKATDKQVMVKLYEHHRASAKRKKFLLRTMPVSKIIVDDNNGLALIGPEFMMNIEHKSDGGNSWLEGRYIRTLDTYPIGSITYSFKEIETMDDIRIPITVTHAREYMWHLLTTKAAVKPFKVKMNLQHLTNKI